MKNDLAGVFGYTKLPAQLKLARICVLGLMFTFVIGSLLFWALLDEALRYYARAVSDHYTYSSGLSYGYEFFSGVIFSCVMMVGAFGLLEVLKMCLGIGVRLGSEPRRTDS